MVANTVPIYPFERITKANTSVQLITRVQQIIDYLNAGYIANGVFGSNGQVLTSAGPNANAYWANATGGGGGGGNAYGTIEAAGQQNLVAAATNSIFTFVAGNGIALFTNVSSDGALHVSGVYATANVPGIVSIAAQIFAGDKSFYGNTTANNLTVSGNTTVNNLSFTGDVTSNINVAGLSHFTGNATFTGYANLASTLQVAGLSLFNGNVTVNAALVVAGNSSVSGNGTISGNLTVGGFANVAGNLEIDGVSLLASNVTVTNIFTSTSNTSVSLLTITPNTVFNGLSTFNANVTLAAGAVLGVTGNASVTGNTHLLANLTVDGLSTLTGNATLSGYINVAGLSTHTGNATFGGFVNVASTLQVAGNVVFNGTRLLLAAGYETFANVATPATPGANSLSVFAQTNQGHTQLNSIDEDGTVLQFQRDRVLIVKNLTGAAVTKGQLVDIFASSGQTPQVRLAQANIIGHHAEGIMFETVSNNAFGLAMLAGVISGLDTSAQAEGTPLYLSATPGAYTNTIPVPASNSFSQRIGIVTNSHVSQGSILVIIDQPFPFDVNVYSLAVATTLLINGNTTLNGAFVNVTTGNVHIGGNLVVDGLSTQTGNATFGAFVNVATTLQTGGHVGIMTLPDANAALTVNGQYFSPFFNDGNSGAAKTIDWNNGNEHYLTLNANCTLSFSHPKDGARYMVEVNSGSGGWSITWPAAVKWPDNRGPIQTQYTNKSDLYVFIYNGTLGLYRGSYNQNYDTA